MNKNILIIPGAYDLVKNYGGYPGIDIWLGENKKEDQEKIKNSVWIFGASAGSNYILSSPVFNKQKLILFNPLVKKRSKFALLIRCLRFMLSEKVAISSLIPLSSYFYAFKKLYRLINFDTLAALRLLPKNSFIIMRGKQDIFLR